MEISDEEVYPLTEDEVCSLAEVEEAVGRLTPVEIVQLRQFARARLVFSDRELSEDELISEALARSLEGTRHWNRKLNIVQHLIGVMRSLAGDQRRTRQAKSEILAEDVGCSEEFIADETIEITDILDTETILSVIFRTFQDDGHSMIILKGLLEGEKRQETMSRSGLSEREYGAARKRITRRMVQMRDGGQI